jgi:hypothetical protein
VISWDSSTGAGSVLGTKVAFVESASGQNAHFHVLAFKAGDGQDATNLQNTLKPLPITTFVPGDPAAGSGTATDLALSADFGGPDTISPPFVDYMNDYAYVGNDAGDLYRIKDVFCPSFNTDTGCTSGAGPSLDTSWGSGTGYVEVGSGCGQLSGAVEDFTTGNVYVGCADGFLYGFTSTGAPLPGSSHGFIFLGDGEGTSPNGGIVVPPLVDSSNGLVYAVSGNNGTTVALLQTNTAFGASSIKRVGLGSSPASGENPSIPTFNTAYYSSGSSSSWALLECGYNTLGTATVLYAVSFTSARALTAGTPPASNQFTLATDVEACSPLTGFTNLGAGPPFSFPTDWLFMGLSGGTISNYNINNTTGSGFGGGFAATATYPVTGGPSGIIVDNESTDPQASSMYFSGLGSQSCGTGGTGYCAVKLTQSGLD